MTEELYRLVYYSRNQVTGDADAFQREVSAILKKSCVNNERDRITGALMFNTGCFAQVLEGQLERIETTFERIQRDERHGEVSLLALERIEQRSFPNWAMGFVGQSSRDAARFGDIASATGFELDRMDGDQIHTLLKDLAIDEERAAA